MKNKGPSQEEKIRLLMDKQEKEKNAKSSLPLFATGEKKELIQKNQALLDELVEVKDKLRLTENEVEEYKKLNQYKTEQIDSLLNHVDLEDIPHLQAKASFLSELKPFFDLVAGLIDELKRSEERSRLNKLYADFLAVMQDAEDGFQEIKVYRHYTPLFLKYSFLPKHLLETFEANKDCVKESEFQIELKTQIEKSLAVKMDMSSFIGENEGIIENLEFILSKSKEIIKD